jgi:hypothetical protein
MRAKTWIILGLILLGAYFWQGSGPITHEGLGQVAPMQPVQTDTAVGPFKYRDSYAIRPLADFRIEARVLSRKRYRFDRAASICPVDLALGWGPMSDDDVLSHLRISQSGRWFHWRDKTLPIPRQEIERHAANMHLIPANRKVDRAIKSARPGDVVRFEGHLVKVHGEDGWSWVSSLTRTDVGAGACEIVLVNAFQVMPRR